MQSAPSRGTRVDGRHSTRQDLQDLAPSLTGVPSSCMIGSAGSEDHLLDPTSSLMDLSLAGSLLPGMRSLGREPSDFLARLNEENSQLSLGRRSSGLGGGVSGLNGGSGAGDQL